MQPLMIDLNGKKVVFAGGGKIAARKAKVLEAEQANVTFIAPDFSDEVLELSRKNDYTLIKRNAVLADFENAILVVLATNDREVNQKLAESIPPTQLVCVTDAADEGNVLFPSSFRRGHLQISISSDGASPKLSRMLKEKLAEQFDESWEIYTKFLSQCRQIIKNLPCSSEQKHEMLGNLLNDCYRLEEQSRTDVLNELYELVLKNNIEG